VDERFHFAFEEPKGPDAKDLAERATRVIDPAAVACWKLAELQSRATYAPQGAAERAPQRFWLSEAEVAGPPEVRAALRRDLLASCLPVLRLCRIEAPDAAMMEQTMHPGMAKQIRAACEALGAGAPAGCAPLIKPPPQQPPPSALTPEQLKAQKEEAARRARRHKGLGWGALGLSLPLVGLGIAQLAVPLRVDYGARDCVQHGLYHPCGPSQLGLGIPLVTAGVGFGVAAGVWIHKAYKHVGDGP
jgi:hypothetical protein